MIRKKYSKRATIHRGLKLAHLGGLVIFLGSILTFVVISALLEGSSLENVVFGRQIISTGTNTLTLPGMWVIAVTGVWMGYKRYGPKRRYFQIKALIITLVVINSYLFIVPAATLATELAIQSLEHDQLLPAYNGAYLQESAFGVVNVLLTVAAAAIGVWQIGAKT